MEFPFNAPRLCMYWRPTDLLKEVLTMWSLTFDFIIMILKVKLLQRKENGKKGGCEEGLEALFTWTLNRDRVGGELREGLFSTLRYCLKKGCGGVRNNKKDSDERCHIRVRVKTFFASPLPPPPRKVGMKRGLSASHR